MSNEYPHKERKYVCCFGEILWDILPTGKQPGGAPMNVGLHLRNLGIEVAMITRIGDDDLGREIASFVASKDCPTRWIQQDPNFPTGKVLANVANRNEVTYEILNPVAWDFIQATPESLEIAKGSSVFVFGSLACRSEASKHTLFSLLRQTRGVKICDVNLRAPHFTKELISELLNAADIAKMNKEELEIISSWHGGAGSIHERAKFIKNKFHLAKIIITLGSEGALLADESGFHSSKIFSVTVKDTIGSGDSFLAGIIKNLLLGSQPQEMINYACALGALVAQHHGANPAIKERDIFELMKK